MYIWINPPSSQLYLYVNGTVLPAAVLRISHRSFTLWNSIWHWPPSVRCDQWWKNAACQCDGFSFHMNISCSSPQGWLSGYPGILYYCLPWKPAPLGNEKSIEQQAYDRWTLWSMTWLSSSSWSYACLTCSLPHFFRVISYLWNVPSDLDARRMPRQSTIEWYILTPPLGWALFLASCWCNISYGWASCSHPHQYCGLTWWGKPFLYLGQVLNGSWRTVFFHKSPEQFGLRSRQNILIFSHCEQMVSCWGF